MGQEPGHGSYQSVSYKGGPLSMLKRTEVEHTLKNHPEIMNPPPLESPQKPNLSSLENYARSQKPAPGRKS